MGDIKCGTIPSHCTHTFQHSHQPYSIWVHNKISKTNFRCKVLEGKTLCTSTPPPNFSHNHEVTTCGYTYITKVYPK